MSRRVSHSLLDPIVGPRLQALYPLLRIPKWFPPEGIVLIGHVSAIVGAVGFAFSTQYWWGGLLGCAGVIGNHTADCVDGTHARATGQCRNGGELLDHFTDPLSFAYVLIGLAVACGRLDLGLAAVCCLFAMAVLTNIKAKMTGEFKLSAFGPTEFKSALAVSGIALSIGTTSLLGGDFAPQLALYGYATMVVTGIIMLVYQLVTSVIEVNHIGGEVDTTEWVTRTDLKTSQTIDRATQAASSSASRQHVTTGTRAIQPTAVPDRVVPLRAAQAIHSHSHSQLTGH